MSYGWLIKHERTGCYAVVNAHPFGLDVTVTTNPAQATMFGTRAFAVETIQYLEAESSTFPKCDVVDYTTPEQPIPDADQTPVPTRAAIIAAAVAGGAGRRAEHAAARALHRSRPNARLIGKPHPTNKAN